MGSLANILWFVVAVVLLLWLLGAVVGFAGSLIHLLLVVAAVIIVYNLLTGRRGI